MKTIHRTLLASMISLGLATATVAHADSAPQFAGPRNTIHLAQSGLRSTQANSEVAAKQATRMEHRGLRASNGANGACDATSVVHHGHPSKGYDQVERTHLACGHSRVAEL